MKQKITVEITQYALKGLRGRVISSDNGSRGRAKSPKVPKCLQERNPARRPGGFEIRRKKGSTYKQRGTCNPPIKVKHTPLLRIANPQNLNRLGHFLTPDFKSDGTPGGLAFLKNLKKVRYRLITPPP